MYNMVSTWAVNSLTDNNCTSIIAPCLPGSPKYHWCVEKSCLGLSETRRGSPIDDSPSPDKLHCTITPPHPPWGLFRKKRKTLWKLEDYWREMKDTQFRDFKFWGIVVLRIREDSLTTAPLQPLCPIFFNGKKKLHVTCDMWHVTCDTWHITHNTWHIVLYELSLKISAS